MYTVTNIDNVVKTFETDDDFLKYAQSIYRENEDGQPYPSEIHWCPENIQQAKEYIHEYCQNLSLEEDGEWEPPDPETKVFNAMQGGTDGG